MPRRLSGQLTVFMALLFMLVVSLLMAQYRSALFYARRADAERAAALSVSSLLAEYQRPLRDYYQILSVDGGFGQDIFQEEILEERLKAVFAENLNSSLGMDSAGEIQMDEPIFTMLIDGNWDFFLREISLNRTDAMLSEGLEYIIDQWQSKKKEEVLDLSQKQAEAVRSGEGQTGGENKNTGAAENEGLSSEPAQPVIDPRDFVMEIWNQGILAAACPATFSVSEKSCVMTDVSFPEAGRRIQAAVDFGDSDSVKALMDQWENILEPGSGIRELVEDAAVRLYIGDVFQNAASKEVSVAHERVLDYEVEYIIAGNTSDRENLETVLWKLMAFRSVMNLSHILMSAEKGMQVEETAVLLSAALLIPQFVKVIAFLSKTAWAFAEALSECRTLLKGGKVPLIKSAESWYLSWEQMLWLDGGALDGNSGDEGTDYEGYLQMLLLLTKRDTKYRRMTHLMEKNIRLLPEYADFRMAHCIYGVQVIFDYEAGMGMKGRVQTALSY